ncbi:EcsC family protein [Pseudoroseicyclus tamaricis]|uniref:EcsC family protein n=1 Tax=Pseudoroseicyclus tamaricis TaxID=2705421 RepID=A0A6B2JUR9_9RHOB|nr:EcsC family protein [Pseudoroseicyclus tamaricis]NDV00369.1 EcsC family protein [Pseudoroseicyclus tamaricis]
MSDTPTMRTVNPDIPLDDAGREEIAELARRQLAAGGILIRAVNLVGGQVEDGLKLLPKSGRAAIENAARIGLERAYHLARRARGAPKGDALHRAIGTASGALGGFGGLGTALAEVPVATTIIFRAVQGVAEEYGEDPDSEEVRLECLRVFGAGGPGAETQGIDTAFLGARMTLTGPALHKMIARVAPKFATVLTQKLATQAVPILGAFAGAGTNYAFVGYYTEMAHVHFGLRRLIRTYNEEQVLEHFHRELSRRKMPVKVS